MKNKIILKKVKIKKKLLNNITNTALMANMTQVLCILNYAYIYK